MYLVLFENCMLVKGVKNAIIIDLQYHYLFNVSLDVYNFLIKCKKNKLKDVLEEYDAEDVIFLNSLINSLLEHKLVHIIENKNNIFKWVVSTVHKWEINP